jgi:hypothetical protein
VKQQFNFEGMIKDLVEHQQELKIRRSDINLSSFDSYFKRMTKAVEGSGQTPESME